VGCLKEAQAGREVILGERKPIEQGETDEEMGRTIMLASHIVRKGGRTTTVSCEAAETMREMAFATSGREVSSSAGDEGSPGRLRSGKSIKVSSFEGGRVVLDKWD
jgi:hypothetical protein